MTIKLYKCVSDPKTVTKILNDELTITGIAKDPVNVVNPIIEIEGNNDTLAGYNYAYIQDYARYYFVSPQADSYNLNTFSFISDVLMTAKPWLLSRLATVTRNEKLYNSYLTDPDFNAYAYRNIVTKAFPSGITEDNIILMTVG